MLERLWKKDKYLTSQTISNTKCTFGFRFGTLLPRISKLSLIFPHGNLTCKLYILDNFSVSEQSVSSSQDSYCQMSLSSEQLQVVVVDGGCIKVSPL